MRAIPSVDTRGVYVEDVLLDDSFSGVVPFYVDNAAGKKVVGGYHIGAELPPGLYRPRFDFAAWKIQTAPYWVEDMTDGEIEELQKPGETSDAVKIIKLQESLDKQTDQTLNALDAVATLFEQLLDVQTKLDAMQGGGGK